VSLAIDCKEDSSAIDAGSTGFGSKAERFPKSNVTGIAFSGFIDLKSQFRIKEGHTGNHQYRQQNGSSLTMKKTSDNFLCFNFFYISQIPCNIR
jgi:hypothetical protein